MNYLTHDTDWAISAKGNHWRRQDGIAIVVGRKKDGTFWAMVDGRFVEGLFLSATEAKAAAECDLRDQRRF